MSTSFYLVAASFFCSPHQGKCFYREDGQIFKQVVKFLSVEIIQPWLDIALCNLINSPYLWDTVGLGDFQKSLPSKILAFHHFIPLM